MEYRLWRGALGVGTWMTVPSTGAILLRLSEQLEAGGMQGWKASSVGRCVCCFFFFLSSKENGKNEHFVSRSGLLANTLLRSDCQSCAKVLQSCNLM